VRKPPGQALSDFRIFRLIANAWGCGEMFAKWTSPEAVFRMLQELSAGQPCDITGIDGYDAIDAAGGIQWPFPKENADPARERRLFADARFYTPDGKAKFFYDPPKEHLPEEPDADYPFLLLTGRGSSSQWHTETRTAKSAILRKLSPVGLHVEIHPADATKLGIREKDLVEIRSRRGKVVAQVYVTSVVQPGQIFLPMHDREVNRLTHASFDPHSRQPSYKASAVAMKKAE